MLSLARVMAFCAFFYVSSLFAQSPGTGLYSFGSFDSAGFDTINKAI